MTSILNFGIFKSIYKGFPPAPPLHVLATEGFGYFLTNSISTRSVGGIAFPKSSSQFANSHFVDVYFLTLIEYEQNV